MLQDNIDLDASSKDAAPPESKHDLLLKFKTITSLLSALQSIGVPVGRLGLNFPGTHAIESHLDMCRSQDLSVLTALATVLPRDDEVVAVATKNRVPGGPLEILAMYHAPSDDPSTVMGMPGIEIITGTVGKDNQPLTEKPNHSIEPFSDHAADTFGVLNLYIQPGETDNITTLELIHFILAKSVPKLHRTSMHDRSRRFRSVIESITLAEVHAVPLLSWNPSALSRTQARNELRFLRTLWTHSAFVEKLNIRIPRLMAEAAWPGRRTRTCYNAATRRDIHVLLNALLETVDFMVHALFNASSSSGKNANTVEGGLVFLITHLALGMYLLWVLVYSPALGHHLERIQGFLHARLQGLNAINLDLDEAGEGIDGRDAEWPPGISSTAGRPSAPVVSLMRWLRQRVAVIQSVHVLTQFKANLAKLAKSGTPPPPISIKCVSVDRQGGSGKMQYDWRRVVTELAPFPTDSGECSAESAIQVVLEALEHFAGEDDQSFKGNVHCEAYLASLMRSEDVPQHIRREFEDVDRSVMGTSTRCCLVCIYLLEIFADENFDRTYTCGSHYTVYPCALPPCLPVDVIQRMVDVFEYLLQDSLLALIVKARRPPPDPST